MMPTQGGFPKIRQLGRVVGLPSKATVRVGAEENLTGPGNFWPAEGKEPLWVTSPLPAHMGKVTPQAAHSKLLPTQLAGTLLKFPGEFFL